MTIFDALELLVHKKLLVIRNSICFYYQIARSKSFKYNKAHHFSSDCTFIEIQREFDTFFYFLLLSYFFVKERSLSYLCQSTTIIEWPI